MCCAGQSKTQEGPWGRRGTRLEHEGTSLCMGNGSSMDISEKMSACSETGRDWTFYEKKRMVESARKKGHPTLENPHFSAKTSIQRDGWLFACQFGMQNYCDELCVRYYFPARFVPGCASLSFALCHLFFSSLKHFNCLISLQSQQPVR